MAIDFAATSGFLMNGLAINFKLWQNPDSFRLMSAKDNADYKLEITDAVLKMCAIDVEPQVLTGHAEALKIKPAIYEFMQSDMKFFSIGKGQFSFTFDNLKDVFLQSCFYLWFLLKLSMDLIPETPKIL